MRFLRSSFKKTVAAVLASVMLLGLLLTGCSTPKNAAVIDGVTYSTGEYLAYMYNAYQTVFTQNNLYYAAYYGQDPWAQKLKYGEGDDAKDMSVEEYIKQFTKDSMIRQKAIANKLDEYGFKYDEEDFKTYEENMAKVTDSSFLPLGFNKKSYQEMYKALSLNENTLFYGIYDNKGPKAMSEAEIRKYYDDNILSYKLIEISLTDDQGKDLTEKEVAKIKERLNNYLAQYTKSKNFDAVIEQYNKDEEAANSSTTSNASTTATTSASTTASTTTTTSTTSTSTTSTTSTSTTSTKGTDKDSDEDKDVEDEEEKDPNLVTIDANTYGDEDFTKAIKTVPVGQAKVVEYKKSGTTNTAALVLRIDSETTEYNFKDSRDVVIYGAKFKEFDKEIKEYMATLTSEFNKTVVKTCSPKEMEATINANS